MEGIAFLDVLLDNVGGLFAVHDEIVPSGGFFQFSGALVHILAIGRQSEAGDRGSVGGVLDLRIDSDVSQQDGEVN